MFINTALTITSYALFKNNSNVINHNIIIIIARITRITRIIRITIIIVMIIINEQAYSERTSLVPQTMTCGRYMYYSRLVIAAFPGPASTTWLYPYY